MLVQPSPNAEGGKDRKNFQPGPARLATARAGLSGKLFAVGRRSMALEEELTNGRKPGPKSQISKK